MTDIHARMLLAKPAFVVTRIKKNGIIFVIFSHILVSSRSCSKRENAIRPYNNMMAPMVGAHRGQ